MKKILKYGFVLVLLTALMPCTRLRAQVDAQYSQFYANRLFYNPAAIHSDGLFRVSLTDREQYWGTPNHPSYRLLNASYFFQEQKMGVGLTVHQWNANIENDIDIKASYMYRLQVGYDAYFNFGLGIGMIHRFLSRGTLPDGSGYVPGEEDFEKFNPNLDMGLGVEFHTSHILAGVSVQHFPIKLGDNPARAALHSYYYFGYNFGLDENWALFPMVVVRMGDRRTNVDVNVRALYRDIVNFGVSYRIDAVSVMAGVNINKNFSLSYAFDYNIGVTSHTYKPSHELILTYRANWKKKGRPLLRFD
ncbi:MAG: PorP/SprF family type IX secretion system membrane protein [Bacteroidales bacterium]|nr:PorP/SprF family type IX secretion system membrane protein [Bacteroidales bacterium]MDE7072692.1 PorP/SprF family type IX secretion system membrane protein [Bacteroidales bacterium]